jgi:hypothetical protein
MASRPEPRLLSSRLTTILLAAGALDVLLGAVFFTGPETGLSLWPTTIPPLLLRFVGAIVLASGVGVIVAARQRTWEGARALFWLGLVYSVASLVGTVYHLVALNANAAFWGYAALDVVYLVPIVGIILANERPR